MNIFFFRKNTYAGNSHVPSIQILKKVYPLFTGGPGRQPYLFSGKPDRLLVCRIFLLRERSWKLYSGFQTRTNAAHSSGNSWIHFIPHLFFSKKSGIHSQLTAVIAYSSWINGGICILIFVSDGIFFPLVFGASFNNMYLLFLFLIPGILSITMNYPMAPGFRRLRELE